MNLGLRRHGKQFFFCTACLEGRPQVLSCLVEGAPRPVLLPPGEGVKAALLAVHGRNSALAASDFVIMPDHVHFLLIADFDRDPGFDPLAFMHRWRDEAAGRAGFQRTGGSPPNPPGRALRWERGFWLALSFSSRQLAAIRAYIRGNPARALWKKAHPDRFRVMAGIRHPSLDPALEWSAMGDPTLLASPFRFPVRLTRKLPLEAQEGAITDAVECARRGMVPVCGFLSSAERELEGRLRAEPGTRWIKALPHGLPPDFDPPLDDSRDLAAGRLLLLTAFPPDVPAVPISRVHCETMNDRLSRLCGEAAEPIATHG